MSLADDLILDEGLRLKPYKDTVGKTTIGVGRNLDDVGISEEEARQLLANDIANVEAGLDHELPWWRSQPEPVQRAIGNMAFQLGISGLLQFKNMLQALESGNYEGAKQAALASTWAKEVPDRAVRITALFTP